MTIELLSPLQGGEGDFAMHKIGPVNGLKVRVIEELPRLQIESYEWCADSAIVVNRGKLALATS